MPPQFQLNIEQFIEVASKYKIFAMMNTSSMNIKEPSDPWWLDISKDMEYALSAKYACTIVKTYRYGVVNKLFLIGTKNDETIISTNCNDRYSTSSLEETEK